MPESFHTIRAFLDAVRRRLRGRAAKVAALYAATATAFVLLVAPLTAALLRVERAAGLRMLAALLVVATAAIGVLLAVVVPRRRYAHDPDVARYVGAAAPQIASDLLSTVELEGALAGRSEPVFSRELALALADSTAARVRTLEPAALVPERDVRRAARTFAAALAVYAGCAALFPSTFAAGWRRILAPPPPDRDASGAIPVAEPLVGDILLTFTYPAYMKRPPLTVPASSGDISAPRGTEVAVETIALRPALAAKLVFDASAGAAELPMKVDGRTLRATFRVDKPGSYRVLLQPPAGRPLLEADPHRIDVEPDRAPRVELFAPADELEVSSRKRVELAYTADDDYGITEIALVWRGPSGKDERKVLPPPRAGGRAAQGKFLWDLSDVPLQPGARVAYHLQVRDNDDVGGPNVGSSRTFYLRVYSPRERHAEVLERQQAVLETAIALLADRLEAAPGDVARRRELNRAAQHLVVELGQLAAHVGQDPLSTKGLKGELEAMRGRLEKLAREEEALLDDLDARAARAQNRSLPKAQLDRLGPVDGRNVAELEKDVLSLDDWLARQRLEEMLAITDEIQQRREKLARLMEEYKRTGSEAVRAEIERELKALAELQEDLARKQARLGGELADRYLNADALDARDANDCLAEVRELIEKGDVARADAKLAECNEMMDATAQALASGLRGLRGDKFSEEEKAYAELMDEIADLEEEQRELARESGEILERYKKRAAEVARDRSNPQKKKAKKTLEKLKKELAAVPQSGLTPFAQEEYDAVMKRLDDVGRMIDEGDVAEALAMAREAEHGLRTIGAELDDDMADGEPWSDHTDEAIEGVHAAQPLAEQLVEELERATPSPREILSGEDRRRMDELEKRQQGLRERARKLAQKAQKKARDLPGNAGETAQHGLDDASQHMQRSAKRFGEGEPQGAREEAEAAADKLAGLRRQMDRSSRPTTVGSGRDVDDGEVRIPGAEEYRPPEEFREDILEAKRKGKAPEGWADQIDRYYEELVK